jgi:hypothetical protein
MTARSSLHGCRRRVQLAGAQAVQHRHLACAKQLLLGPAASQRGPLASSSAHESTRSASLVNSLQGCFSQKGHARRITASTAACKRVAFSTEHSSCACDKRTGNAMSTCVWVSDAPGRPRSALV